MKTLIKLLVAFSVFVFLSSVSAFAADKGNFSTAPRTNDGKKWRVGYYEGGPYIDYQKVLIAVIKGLMGMGWIETAEIPQQKGEQTKKVWNWLTINAKSKYIEFVKDAHYSTNWDKDFRKKMAADIISRLNIKKDIDLILAFGTWAGQDLANDKHNTPTMSHSVSDPFKARIIKSNEDSGYDHMHARIDPFRYERQIQVFHDIIGFKKLGMAYEDSPAAKTYAAIDDVENIAKKRKFEIVSCYTKSDIPDEKLAEESVKKCFRELGEKKVDAIYVTMQNGVNKKSIPELLKIINFYKIPTFSQSTSEEVKYGFLMSISRQSFDPLGRFHAEAIAKVFNGAKPRQLEMIFEAYPKIAINLKEAELIEYDPPMEVLGITDEIYTEIETPKQD